MFTKIPPEIRDIIDVWKAPQLNLPAVVRWEKYLKEEPGIREQNSLEHSHSLSLLGSILVSRLQLERSIDFGLLMTALVIHDVGEGEIGEDTHYIAIPSSPVAAQVHPAGIPSGYQCLESASEFLIGQGSPVFPHKDAAVLIHGDNQTLSWLNGACFTARQLHIDPALHDRRGYHEDDEQDERNVHERRDIYIR